MQICHCDIMSSTLKFKAYYIPTREIFLRFHGTFSLRVINTHGPSEIHLTFNNFNLNSILKIRQHV